jgi:hypothetical protein
MGITKQKTFSATTKEALDQAVNDFIGKHIVDNAIMDRQVKFIDFVFVAPNFYASIIYEEINLSAPGN